MNELIIGRTIHTDKILEYGDKICSYITSIDKNDIIVKLYDVIDDTKIDEIVLSNQAENMSDDDKKNIILISITPNAFGLTNTYLHTFHFNKIFYKKNNKMLNIMENYDEVGLVCDNYYNGKNYTIYKIIESGDESIIVAYNFSTGKTTEYKAPVKYRNVEYNKRSDVFGIRLSSTYIYIKFKGDKFVKCASQDFGSVLTNGANMRNTIYYDNDTYYIEYHESDDGISYKGFGDFIPHGADDFRYMDYYTCYDRKTDYTEYLLQKFGGNFSDIIPDILYKGHSYNGIVVYSFTGSAKRTFLFDGRNVYFINKKFYNTIKYKMYIAGNYIYIFENDKLFIYEGNISVNGFYRYKRS